MTPTLRAMVQPRRSGLAISAVTQWLTTSVAPVVVVALDPSPSLDASAGTMLMATSIEAMIAAEMAMATSE